MTEARQRILERLRTQRTETVPAPTRYDKPMGWDRADKITMFIERMTAVRGEVHRLDRDRWVDWLLDEMPARGLRRALIGGGGEIADRFATSAGPQFEIRRYAQPIDQWKQHLFDEVDFALTGAHAGLAESGSLVLRPDAAEPRLMSLVPPVHIAVLDADHLYDNFADLLASEDWTAGMPSNALLVSGPSKTADIEQTLAFGIHGPKELITLLIE
jgi:L-lactate dehydrogenase complex protein LldG